ncbi:MAG: rod shape-determining protein MreC [Legionellales bacterium RIFCSPHIGHO2_12_FULL_42_9]|nr:MAG: rod shape-determining protein MreC [Legionellales bacterium RIFCSPHIGHO2_12_FULL_42_9]
MISSQLNNSTNLLFRKGKDKATRFVFAVLLSIACIFFDYHYPYLGSVRSGFSFFAAPLQYFVDYPVRVMSWMQSLVSAKKVLIDENIKLHYRQTILEAELQKLMAIKQENSQLKQLLLASSKEKMNAMAAQILAVDATNSRQLVILDKGKRDGVYVGQPVLDAKGVMGQIIDVGYLTSTVLLISDSKSAVPVSNNRTGEHAILVGTNDAGLLSLINLPHTASIAKGDLLVTSGLGRLYPEGYPVGRVEKITHIPGEEFIKVDVYPVALLNRNRLVLLIWPDKNHALLTRKIHERMVVIGKMT